MHAQRMEKAAARRPRKFLHAEETKRPHFAGKALPEDLETQAITMRKTSSTHGLIGRRYGRNDLWIRELPVMTATEHHRGADHGPTPHSELSISRRYFQVRESLFNAES